MIIDCEVYNVTKPLAGKSFGLPGLLQLAREAGVDRTVLMPDGGIRPDNHGLAEMVTASPEAREHFVLCAWLNPHFGEEAVRELEIAVKEWGFRGLKLMPTHHNFRAVSQVPYPLMRKAEELKIPVSIHSGTFFCYPLEIMVLADAFPNVPVIMDHMGYRYYVAEAIAAARRATNVYLATTAVMEPHWIRQAVRELGAERVLFGSNAPHVWPTTQLLVIHQAELTEAEEKQILGENAARLYHLD
ncbi:MAG: amidohydrolase family protein [Anaerolineae bacterium]